MSSLLKYVFIFLIYIFIYWIARLIYLDIAMMVRFPSPGKSDQPYFKLVNRRDQLGFKVEESYPISDLTTIGRSTRNDIILRDPYISSEHALVRFSAGTYLLEDLESTNGTFVNGVKINGPVTLKNGDRISLSQVDFLFVVNKSVAETASMK